ncbi:unnamed protein product [Phytophthora lilii]|uniref:Unnamed protein product n=1 Tax=Phytophthora lilii TaxID=2077276 RepID=A0A9W6U356_9STRA|nr:unnamed protein product [Phytophthora lilii]
MKLDDGHVLKVTVAKERPAGGNGKLKRDQHARQDLDEKTEGLREDDGGIDARLPGKRQRSSPPVAALPSGPSRVSPSVLLDNRRLDRFAVDATKATKSETMLANLLPPPADASKDESMEPDLDQKQVEQVVCAMLAAVEQHEVRNKSSSDLFAAYQHFLSTLNRGLGQKRGGNLMVMVPGAKEESEEETSTDSLASSIRSVSLTSTPMTVRGSSFSTSLRTPRLAARDNGAVPPPRSKHHLRRRRQSLDGSGSSTEDGSDGSGIRRKRSNTTTSPPQTLKTRNPQPLSPPRKFSDRSDISLSPDVLKAEIISKKLCKRQSSDNAIEGPYRQAKQQVTQGRRDLDGAMVDCGRIRPCITDPSTAAFVVKSFRDESSQGDEDPERPEFMTLSFAHESGCFHSHQKANPAHFHSERPLGCQPNLEPRPTAPSIPTTLTASGKDRLWVLLLYDRFLATHMLSSVVSSFSGMEFMDIKMVKSTGEAQGVAFVKFDCETSATQAALQLHQMELPLGSGKFLQAIVILAPSLFTTTHGSNSISTNESLRLDRKADERVVTGSSEDVDLLAVEARFAHLMRSTDHPYTREGPYFPHYSSPRGSISDQLSPMAGVYPPSQSAGYHTSMGMSTGMEYYPMQLVTYPPPQQQPFQPYASFGGPTNYQQLPQHQGFGGSAPGWVETTPFYPPQYTFPGTPAQEMAFSVVNNTGGLANENVACAVPPKPRSSRSPSEQMEIEDGNSSCSSQASSSIHVSTDEPLELVTLVNALQDCPGVVSFAKDATAAPDLTGYMVDFAKETQALEAVHKLDGLLCGGQKLRVAKTTSTRHRGGGGGGKARSSSGRRKRQRVDPRSRK